MAVIQTDLPEPVAPATSMCGIRERSATTGWPETSRPRAIANGTPSLLNESLSSTSPGESLYLSRDIVRALRLFGVRAIFATHLHELAEGLEAVNADIEGDSRVVSLVAGVALQGAEADLIDGIIPRTYEIKPGPPRGLSYARGIAAKHGISYEQLAEQRHTRQKPE